MPDIITVLSVFAGFAFVIVVGAKLGAGSTDSVIGVFRFEDHAAATAAASRSPTFLASSSATRRTSRPAQPDRPAPATGQSRENRGMADGPTFISAIVGVGIAIFACWMLGVGCAAVR